MGIQVTESSLIKAVVSLHGHETVIRCCAMIPIGASVRPSNPCPKCRNISEYQIAVSHRKIEPGVIKIHIALPKHRLHLADISWRDGECKGARSVVYPIGSR